MQNLTELLQKAQAGKLETGELAYVAERIKASKPGDDQDLYTLIDILGKTQAKEYRSLVEGFLDYPSDPQIPKIALETLCLSWELTHEYLPLLKQIIKTLQKYEDLRKDDAVRLVALKCIGEYIQGHRELELLELLLSTQACKNNGKEIIQYGAYIALIRAMGKDWSEIPKFEDVISKNGSLEPNSLIINEARYWLQKECMEQVIMWGYTKPDLDTIKKLIKGVEWDEDNKLCTTALICLGFFLNQYVRKGLYAEEHKELIQLILDIYHTTKDDSVRETAFSTLSKSTGAHPYELTNPKSRYYIYNLTNQFGLC